MGGKRVCLGKTFAETNIRFTIPLLYHHFEFSFVDKAQGESKQTYFLGGKEEVEIPIKIKIKNLVV